MMPQESNFNSIFTSPTKNLRGLKALVSNNNNNNSYEEIINDHELAHRKAEEAASRRNQAAQWLRKMGQGASESLSKEPSEEEFCLSLRNGLILCNVLNKVNPGAVFKVVENPIIPVQSLEGPAAQSAIQYFENMRNFLEAVKNMKLLTFEASDLEKGGSSSKVVDCILCLKGYYEWKLAGGIGVWRYGGTVRITNFQKESSSSNDDQSFDESESLQYDQLLEFLDFSEEVSAEESRIANVLTYLFDRFGLGILKAYLQEIDELEDLPLNATVVDTLLSKVAKDFSALLVSQGTQLGQFLKNVLKVDIGSLSKSQFLEIISRYLKQRASLVTNDFLTFCVCGGKRDTSREIVTLSSDNTRILDIHKNQLQELKSCFLETRHVINQKHLKWDEDLRRLVLHVKNLEVTSSSYQKVLEENRQLYNQVQDLKGTIRVYCRVRPFLKGQLNGQTTVDYIGENGNIMIVNPLKQGKDTRRIFTFNKVFNTNVTQEQIYGDTQPLVRSVLDGYNVCIFAYGQTGSGKTYTMSGPDLMTEDTWGVNYRALRDLFELSKERMRFVRYEVSVQMIEIYNEQVRDLLVSDGSTRRLDIRNNSQLNGLNVPDACLVPVTCTQDVLDLMKTGHKNRAVGATALNERSSRSHSVLTVHVQGKELVSGTILRGCLHLVDLAGSERVDKSEAVGERLKEAQYINRSLSALGDVIYALAQKSTHIPYRNSKLTQVLQDSLGGHAKTLMFVHVNPEVNAFGETISTLKFAERVACIELGTAKSNKETGEIRDLKDEVSSLKLALERKEAELEQYKSASLKTTMDSQKARAVSPFRLPKYGLNDNLKPENSQVSLDEPKVFEPRSCSAVKQRRPKFPFIATEKETISVKPRSPSPPIRRSISTERGSSIKNKLLRHENSIENNQQPISRVSSKTMHNNVSETSKMSSKKAQQEHEDEQFKQALNIRQGGIRKANYNKSEHSNNNRAKLIIKQQHGQVTTLLSDLVIDEKSNSVLKRDFSENEKIGLDSRRTRKNFSRNSQNQEPRQIVSATMEAPMAGKLENKAPNRNTKEVNSNNVTMPDLRRSRSTPRGKVFMLA